MSEEQNGEYAYLFNGLVHRVKIGRQGGPAMFSSFQIL